MAESSLPRHKGHRPTVWQNPEQELVEHNPPDEVVLLGMKVASAERLLQVAVVSVVGRIATDLII